MARRPSMLGLMSLLCAHIVASCLSLAYAIDHFPGIVAFDDSKIVIAIAIVAPFALVSLLFAIGRFSFGYVVGFYFYTMILGYLWLVDFSVLTYNHSLAIASIFISALTFLVPALFITKPIPQRLPLSIQGFDRLSFAILILSAAIVVVGAIYNFKPVDLSKMYEFRAQLDFPLPLRYAIGISSTVLLPYVFACFLTRRRYGPAIIPLVLMLFFYPVTLTRLALFAPFWLMFLALLSVLVETRTAAILSLFLPISAGVAIVVLTNADMFPAYPGWQYFGTVNSRMIAMPSIALEVYNNFFANHALTHFCQINVLKHVLACRYDEPLSVVLSKAYPLGAFNASLFATEGIASVGLALAPLSALACGLVIGLANRLSSGLSPRFILLSAGLVPQVLLNVPLSVTLVTNGAAILFLLWYITPRALFEDATTGAFAAKSH